MTVATLGYRIDSSQALVAERNLDRMDDAAGRADRGAQRLTRRASILRGAMVRLSSSAGALAGTIAALFGAQAIIGGIADFDQAMSRVQAITRATEEDMRVLRDTASQLGATTEFSATQAADGLRFLGMAGFSATESIQAIPQVLDLATASGMDLASAADTASNIMSAFGIAADNAASVTDVLAAAASRANTDVSQLGTAMSFAGPVASSLGVSVNDAAAAVGVLSDAGIQGSMAGTGLRRVMSSLINPTGEAADAIRSLGVNLDDVNPQTNSLVDIVDRLAQAGLGASEALTIFGDRGGPAILALTSQAPRLRELTEELSNVDGAASQMAETMRDNLRGDLQGLVSALQSVILAMGDAGLTAALRAVVQGITEFVRAITETINFLSEQRGFIIAAAVAITAMYIPALIRVVPLIYSWVTANAALVASFITLRGVLITTGIGAFVVLAGMAINYLIRLRERTGSWAEAFTMLMDVANEVWERIKTGAELLLVGLGIVFNDIQMAWTLAVGRMLEVWNTFLDFVAGGSIGQMMGLEGGNRNAGIAATAQAMGGLNDEFETLISRQSELSDAFNAPMTSLEALNSLMNSTTETSEGTADAVTNAVEQINAALGEPGSTGSGGGGTSEGGLNRLRELLGMHTDDPYAEVQAWYSDALAALADAQLLERGMIDEHNEYRLQIEEIYQRQLAEIRAQANNQQLADSADFFGSLASVAQAGGERMNRVAQVLGAVQATINAWIAYTEVLRDPSFVGRPLARFAAAARVLAAGLGAVRAIRGAGGGGGASGGAPTAAGSTVEQTPERRVMVELRGDDWVRNLVEPLMTQIYEATRDGERVVFAR
jgi:TP901 family phage tail tape measure protein